MPRKKGGSVLSFLQNLIVLILNKVNIVIFAPLLSYNSKIVFLLSWLFMKKAVPLQAIT